MKLERLNSMKPPPAKIEGSTYKLPIKPNMSEMNLYSKTSYERQKYQ